SWWQQKSVLNELLPKLRAVEETSAPPVTEADVKKAVGGKQPAKSEDLSKSANRPYGASRVDVYSWFTVSPVNKRDIYVYYGKTGAQDKEGPEVLSIQGDDKEDKPQQVASGGAAPASGPPTGGASGMMPRPPGGGGPGAGGPGAAGPRGGRPPQDADTGA